jgi:hypothetical protein
MDGWMNGFMLWHVEHMLSTPAECCLLRAHAQILKAFTPALTLVLCVGAGLERASWPLATSVMLIAGGTSMCVPTVMIAGVQ